MYEIPLYVVKVFKQSTQMVDAKKIDNPEVAAKTFRSLMGELALENLAVICLDKQNNFLGLLKVAEGTHDSVPGDRGYIANLVTSIRGTAAWILIHNHLSSEAVPSPEDRALFRAMIKLGGSIERPLLDALIVASGSDKFYSHQNASPYEFMVRD